MTTKQDQMADYRYDDTRNNNPRGNESKGYAEPATS